SVPSATPACSATSRCRTLSKPPSSARSDATSRILFLRAFDMLSLTKHVLLSVSSAGPGDPRLIFLLEMRGDLVRQVFDSRLQRGASHRSDVRPGWPASVHAQGEAEKRPIGAGAPFGEQSGRGILAVDDAEQEPEEPPEQAHLRGFHGRLFCGRFAIDHQRTA